MNLTWLIPIFPLLAFVAVALRVHRTKTVSHRLTVGAVAVSFILAQIVFWKAALLPVGAGSAAFESATDWFPIGAGVFQASVWVDPLTTVMLFAVPLVCLLIFVYSAGYVRDNPRSSRFFAYISLLTASMLGLVVSGNLLMLFIFWEMMGLCAYLLIGLRFEEKAACRAGLKAFLITKVGDVCLLLGLLILYAVTGSLQYRDIFDSGTLVVLTRTGFLGTQFSAATAIVMLILSSVVSQAAQFPLHVWLSDAVEGPAPASALIQSATMAPAGLYLMARCFPLYAAAGDEASVVMIAAGALTVLLATLIATTQNDVRRVLAFSTISQLGCVVIALSAGAYVAGVFHLVTQTFFMALLVLGTGSIVHGIKRGLNPLMSCNPRSQEAGSIVHGMQHGQANPREFNPNDVMNMGGLAQRQPVTCWTLVAGVLSLSGLPLVTLGFWSQDGILNAAYEMGHPAVFWILAITAGLTAFYTTRLLCLILVGRPRSEAAANAHESERSMTIPLIVLAVLAVCLGWGGLIPDWFYRFVGNGQAAEAAQFAWQPLAISAVFTLCGLLAGYLVYGWEPLWTGQTDRLEAGMRRVWMGWLYDVLHHRLYLDEFYRVTFARGTVALARACAGFDSRVLDRAVEFVAQAGWVTARAAGCFETLVVDRVVSWTARIGRATSEIAGRFEALVMNRAVSLVARMSRTVSEATGHFDVLVMDRVVYLAARATRALSEFSSLLDPRVLDPLANAAGQATRALSNASGVFDARVVDGAVEEMGRTVKAGGRFIRPIQTGRVQNYILIAFISVLALVAMYLTMIHMAWW